MRRFWTWVLLAVVALGGLGADILFAQRAGVVLIRDEPDYWDFAWQELYTMRADVVKFHLSYNNQWNNGYPAHFVIPAIHVRGAIWAGARDIIFRTAETRISRNEINHFIQGMRFWDTNERLVDFIYNTRHQVHCWIEVGNEPDLENYDPWLYRWHLIDVANHIIPQWTWLWTMHWIASMPTQQGTRAYPGFAYSNVIYTRNHEGAVQDKYESLGTHAYGFFSLNRNDGAKPMAETDYALARLPAGKTIWVTEAGINHYYDWGTKGRLFRDAIRAGDPRIRGWTFFALTRERFWNSGGLYYGIDLDYTTQQPVPGRPCAVELSRR